jgi:hypothetical protein
MKKGFFLLLLCLVFFASCVKQHACICTTTHSEIPGYQFSETILYTATKTASQANCDANEDNSGPITTTCALK